MNYVAIIGFIAATFTTASFLPQVIRIHRTRKTHDLSLLMYVILYVGILLWIIYGIFLKSLPIIIANSVVIVLCLYILVMKIRYK